MGYRVWDPDRRLFNVGFDVPGDTPWYRYEIEGEWTADNAGGCFNFPEWRKNPQYEIITGEECDAVMLLMQPDMRLANDVSAPPPPAGEKKGGDEGGPAYDKKIGMYLMRGHDRMRQKARAVHTL